MVVSTGISHLEEQWYVLPRLSTASTEERGLSGDADRFSGCYSGVGAGSGGVK